MAEILTYADMEELIPERPPLLMLDRVQLDTEGRRAVGLKNVSVNEAFFTGHFPNAPIMPGVLQVAAMVQVGGLLLGRLLGDRARGFPVCTSIRRLKFRNPVLPGDRLLVEVELAEDDTPPDPAGTTLRAVVRKNGVVTSQGAIRVTFLDASVLPSRPAELVPADPELPWLPASDDLQPVDVGGIMQLIPHRFPFLLVDGLMHLDGENQRVVGFKNVTGNEPFFAGCPLPMVPPYLLIEMAAQTGCALALSTPKNQGKLGYFMAIDEATFSVPVVPGDQLVIDIQTTGRGRFGKAHGRLWVGNREVAVGVLKFAVIDREK
ncbi:MAG: hypothetical protein GXP31_04025 [Kiritimatiellaeota bacterium]|nr:hypothetical protein [Kiritimatiellota bacterium]